MIHDDEPDATLTQSSSNVELKSYAVNFLPCTIYAAAAERQERWLKHQADKTIAEPQTSPLFEILGTCRATQGRDGGGVWRGISTSPYLKNVDESAAFGCISTRRFWP